MITLAFAQMVDFIARQAADYTGGENGLPGIPRPRWDPCTSTTHSTSTTSRWCLAGWAI